MKSGMNPSSTHPGLSTAVMLMATLLMTTVRNQFSHDILCGNMSSKRGHRCVVYSQLAILHHARCLQAESTPQLVKSSTKPQNFAAARADPDVYWNSEDLAQLSL